jgi:hypothetical protein
LLAYFVRSGSAVSVKAVEMIAPRKVVVDVQLLVKSQAGVPSL